MEILWKNFNAILILVTIWASGRIIDAGYQIYLNQDNGLTKLQNAKLLRIDLNNHIKDVQREIKYLDEFAFKEVAVITQNFELNVEKYGWFEEQSNYLKMKLDEFYKQLYESDDLNDIEKKYEELQNILYKVNRELDNNTRDALELLSDYQTKDNVVDIYDRLSSKIIGIKKQVKTIFLNFIINRNFTRAEKILNLNEDDDVIVWATNELYSHDSNNFYLLYQFAGDIRNVTKTWIIVKELNHQIHASKGEKRKILDMYLFSLIEYKIKQDSNLDPSIQAEAKNLGDTIRKKYRF